VPGWVGVWDRGGRGANRSPGPKNEKEVHGKDGVTKPLQPKETPLSGRKRETFPRKGTQGRTPRMPGRKKKGCGSCVSRGGAWLRAGGKRARGKEEVGHVERGAKKSLKRMVETAPLRRKTRQAARWKEGEMPGNYGNM